MHARLVPARRSVLTRKREESVYLKINKLSMRFKLNVREK